MMWSTGSDLDESAATTAAATSSVSSSCSLQPQTPPPTRRQRRVKNGPEAEEVWCIAQWEAAWPWRARPVVLAGEDGTPDGARAGAGDSDVGRARSLTDDDLEELKGCVDLGFDLQQQQPPRRKQHSSTHNNGAAPMELRTASVAPTPAVATSPLHISPPASDFASASVASDCACLIRSSLRSLFPLAGLIPSFCSPRKLLDF